MRQNILLKINLFLGIVLFFPFLLHSQDLGNSPYSRIGVGDIIEQGFAHQAGMSYVGVSFLSPNRINNSNPALLGQGGLTILEAGVIGQLKVIQNQQTTQQDFGVSINYAAIAFPVVLGRWNSSIGLQPFSSVQYTNSFRQSVQNSIFTADYTYQGAGGINAVYWANGFRLTKELYIGFRANYLFGATIEESSVLLNTGQEQSNSTFYQRSRYNGLAWQLGASYQYPIGEKTFLNIGVSYTLEQDLNVKKLTALQIRTLSGIPLLGDTFQDNDKSIITLPSRLQAGISFNKDYHWLIAAEVILQNWENYKENTTTDTLKQSFTAAFGAEYTPDYEASEFFKRSTYRVGFRYTKTPLFVNNTQLNDLSLSAGATFPFNRGYTELHLALTLGQRGTLNNNLLKENYLRFFLGVTINDRWFVKRKID